MFGIQIASMDYEYIADLVAEPKIFDISMSVLSHVDGSIVSDEKIPMTQCTK